MLACCFLYKKKKKTMEIKIKWEYYYDRVERIQEEIIKQI